MSEDNTSQPYVPPMKMGESNQMRRPDDQDGPDSPDEFLPHEAEPPMESAEATPEPEAHEQIGDLVTDTLVEEPDSGNAPDESKRITDRDEAEEVAYASKEEREHAANARASAKWRTEGGETATRLVERAASLRHEADELEAGLRERHGYFFTQDGESDPALPKWREKSEELKEISNKAGNFDEDSELDAAPYDARKAVENFADGYGTIEKAKERIEDSVDKEVEEAEGYSLRSEEEAKRIEEWASILYHHPVSQRFIAEHPDISPETFSARGLAELEREINPTTLLGAAEQLETAFAAAEEYPLSLAVYGISTRHVYFDYVDLPHAPYSMGLRKLDPWTLMEHLHGLNPRKYNEADHDYGRTEEDEAAWVEFYALRQNPDTSLRQLQEQYKKLLHEVVIDPIKQSAEEVKTIFEDIRSGRASEE